MKEFNQGDIDFIKMYYKREFDEYIEVQWLDLKRVLAKKLGSDELVEEVFDEDDPSEVLVWQRGDLFYELFYMGKEGEERYPSPQKFRWHLSVLNSEGVEVTNIDHVSIEDILDYAEHTKESK